MNVEIVSAEAVLPLRGEVLRPGQPVEDAIFPGDALPDTLHVAARVEQQIASVGTVLREPYPDNPGDADWRLRGMATAPSMRGRGLATAVLQRCVEHAVHMGGRRVWCAARPGARRLYERAGFVVMRDDYEVRGIGAHYLMVRELQIARSRAAH